MKTVRETVLEAELEQLKSKLRYYEFRHGRADDIPTLLDEPVHQMELREVTPTLKLAARWDARRSEQDPRNLHVIGRSYVKDGQFAYAYYISDDVLLNANDALNVLGGMHERVIRELARKYVQ